jgi:hypothetical protein
LLTVCSQHTFANAVVRETSLWRLLDLLERPEPNETVDDEVDTSKSRDSFVDVSLCTIRGWTVLEGLSSSPSVVSDLLSTSGWVELLGVLVGYSKFTKRWTSRMGAAKTLSRHLWDPNLGSLAGK